MKFFEKMYVGFQRDRYIYSETPRLLGFAIPYEMTKAGASRIETVKRWASKDIDTRIIENGPTRGFKIVDVASRYSTSNKLFRIADPRGFELEISAENLLDICSQSTIVNGEIIDECVWAQHNKIYLMPTKRQEYTIWKERNSSNKEPTKMESGKYYISPENLVSIFRFEGVFHNTYLNVRHKATEADVTTENSNDRSYYSYHRVISVKKYLTTVEILMNSGKKPSYIYTEFQLDSEGNVKTYHHLCRKSKMKNLIEYQEDEKSSTMNKMKAIHFNPMAWVECYEREYTNPYTEAGKGDLNVNVYNGTNLAFFANKQDAMEFDYDSILNNIKPVERVWGKNINCSEFNQSYTRGYGIYTRDRLFTNINTAEQELLVHDRR